MTYSYAGHDALTSGTLGAIQGVDVFSRNCSQKSGAVCIPSLYEGRVTLICETWITGCRRLCTKTFEKVACSVDCMTYSYVGPGSLHSYVGPGSLHLYVGPGSMGKASPIVILQNEFSAEPILEN